MKLRIKLKTSAPALENGLLILEMLQTGRMPMGFNEIAQKLSVTRVSVSRFLKVLVTRGWVAKDPVTGKYQSGHQLSGSRYSGEDLLGALRRYSGPSLAALARITGNTALAVLWNNRQMLWLAKQMSDAAPAMQEVGVVHTEIDKYPWGWLFWRYEDEKTRKACIPLMDDYKTFVQKQPQRNKVFQSFGCMFDNGEIQPGYRRLAAPVFDGRNSIVGALGLGASIHTMPDGAVQKCARLLAEEALKISRLLGWNSDDSDTVNNEQHLNSLKAS